MRTRLPAVVALTAGAFLVGSPAALAQTADYPGTGESVLPTVVNKQPDTSVSDTGSTRPGALPFTGGELVLISAAGAAAVAAGTALVVGGRRRSTAS
ncbi:MAG TPA: hypothetical protein VNU26_18910 [Mycobacteriales bacterium]|nr:hypothetical protein [Mycobacteriales bacterium]